MKKLIIILCFLSPNISHAAGISALTPYTISADESHIKVVQMTIPNKTQVAVVFTGCDTAISIYENESNIYADIQNKGKTAIITINLPADAPVDTVHPVHITTKEGRTHTIALVNLGTKYKKENIFIKTIINSDKHNCD